MKTKDGAYDAAKSIREDRESMRLVVDASVVAKWFNIEKFSDKAVEVKDAFVSGALELAAPIHIIYKVGNSIWGNR